MGRKSGDGTSKTPRARRAKTERDYNHVPGVAGPPESTSFDAYTVADARGWFRAHLDSNGACCPTCGRFGARYRRRMYSTIARALILLYKRAKPDADGWFHLQNTLGQLGNRAARGGDIAKLQWWGLMERSMDLRDDGSARAGYWRITELGKRFARNECRVPSVMLDYDGKATPLPESEGGTTVSIVEALGTRFSYAEIMGLVPDATSASEKQP